MDDTEQNARSRLEVESPDRQVAGSVDELLDNFTQYRAREDLDFSFFTWLKVEVGSSAPKTPQNIRRIKNALRECYHICALVIGEAHQLLKNRPLPDIPEQKFAAHLPSLGQLETIPLASRFISHFGVATLSKIPRSTRPMALLSPLARYVLLITRCTHTGRNSSFTSSGTT